MERFATVLCVDGSASKKSKRPVYRFRRNASPQIDRFRHADGVLAVLESKQNMALPRPLLITVDVPIGLPAGYPCVWKEFGGFLPWLDERREDEWKSMVVDSVAKQTPQSPFVVCRKDEKKLAGQFPLRLCEARTRGESLYWCVGGKQVGKAALQFWRDTLLPLRKGLGSELAVWPFEPICGKSVVVAECYPAMLHQATWGKRVTKTSPTDVVDVLFSRFEDEVGLCDHKTWLHAASSEDEFDIFTTAVAVASQGGITGELLMAPEVAKPVEGWMLMLPSASRGPEHDSCEEVVY